VFRAACATYLVFIFNQNPWLGLAAIALYPPQIYLIPRLQRKINALSKERVQTARALESDRRIGERSAEIRGNDTFHLGPPTSAIAWARSSASASISTGASSSSSSQQFPGASDAVFFIRSAATS
jgi:hypothetical protein